MYVRGLAGASANDRDRIMPGNAMARAIARRGRMGAYRPPIRLGAAEGVRHCINNSAPNHAAILLIQQQLNGLGAGISEDGRLCYGPSSSSPGTYMGATFNALTSILGPDAWLARSLSSIQGRLLNVDDVSPRVIQMHQPNGVAKIQEHLGLTKDGALGLGTAGALDARLSPVWRGWSTAQILAALAEPPYTAPAVTIPAGSTADAVDEALSAGSAVQRTVANGAGSQLSERNRGGAGATSTEPDPTDPAPPARVPLDVADQLERKLAEVPGVGDEEERPGYRPVGPQDEETAGWSTGAKVGAGVGLLALLGLVAYAVGRATRKRRTRTV